MKIVNITMIISIVLTLTLFGLIWCTSNQNNNYTEEKEIIEEAETILVKDKWIKRTNNKDLYMIGTEKEVFKIEDNEFILKFNSSNIYNQIEVGKKYRIKTTGMRSNLMSWYRNINEIKLCEGE